MNRDARKHTHSRYDGARVRADAWRARWRRRDARTCAAASRVSPKPTTPRRGPARVVVHAARSVDAFRRRSFTRTARLDVRAGLCTNASANAQVATSKTTRSDAPSLCLPICRANRARRRHSS